LKMRSIDKTIGLIQASIPKIRGGQCALKRLIWLIKPACCLS
jgi:hypothetical protein